MDDVPPVFDGRCYIERWGDPATWTGDWRREGKYLNKQEQERVKKRLEALENWIIGAAIRGAASAVIAASLTVSRESVDRRLRPLGLKNRPGNVGRRARKTRGRRRNPNR